MQHPEERSVHELLLRRDYEGLIRACEADRRMRKALEADLYQTDENLLWPAIKTIGGLMHRRWQAGRQESVREYIRGLLWSLNEESGGIGWNAPQTIAEIIVHIPELIVPYGSMAISRALEEPPLVPAGLWALGRLGPAADAIAHFCETAILESFSHKDSAVLALAAWATGRVGFVPAYPLIARLQGRSEAVRIWVGEDFVEKPLAAWAAEAITGIDR
jgi:hypothetical protein